MSNSAFICAVCSSRDHRHLYRVQEHDIFLCNDCAHAQVFPVPSAKDLEDHYSKGFGASYQLESDSQAENVASTFTDDRMLRLFSKLHLPQDTPVLDVGCSFGYDLHAFKEKLGCKNLLGVELSAQGREIARSQLKLDVFPSLENIVDKNIGFAYLKHNLEHHRDPIATLSQLHDVIRPGGYLALIVPSRFSLNGLWGRRWEWMTPPTHLHFFSKESLSKSLSENGFEIKELYVDHGHAMPVLKHAAFFSPGIGQLTRKILGDPYMAKSKMGLARKIFEATTTLASKILHPITKPFGEELWAVALRP